MQASLRPARHSQNYPISGESGNSAVTSVDTSILEQEWVCRFRQGSVGFLQFQQLIAQLAVVKLNCNTGFSSGIVQCNLVLYSGRCTRPPCQERAASNYCNARARILLLNASSISKQSRCGFRAHLSPSPGNQHCLRPKVRHTRVSQLVRLLRCPCSSNFLP